MHVAIFFLRACPWCAFLTEVLYSENSGRMEWEPPAPKRVTFPKRQLSVCGCIKSITFINSALIMGCRMDLKCININKYYHFPK